VKAATKIKDEHLPDCAIQFWVLRGSGIDIGKARLAYINKEFVYPGNREYDGLFIEEDVTDAIAAHVKQTPGWVTDFNKILKGREPDIEVGDHCHAPHECPFLAYCSPRPTKYPVSCLPRGGKVVRELIEEGITDIRKIPAGRLTNETHEWVRKVTRRGKADLRPEKFAHLKELPWPRYFLDFETLSLPVPLWAGTRPYEFIPFQWSCHIESANSRLDHRHFLDTTGKAPLRPLSASLVKALGQSGPIFVYSDFERKCLDGLIDHVPDLAPRLRAIKDRLVDLLPVTRNAYYHPEMKGSWSIKAVLPTIAPHLDYASLGEVQHGGSMNDIYMEITDPATTKVRRTELETALLDYCQRDTLGLVELMRFFMKH
jgi:hypothetical protein